MLHVTDRPSCVAFTVLVVLALIHSCRGRSEVIGPSQPIVATVGDDVVLPCRLEPVLNAVDMTVEWARPDLDPRFVHVWRDGKELESKKHPSYRGRTSLSTEGLKLGDVSLKLSTVEISDEGTYRCFFPELDRAPDVQLLVGAVSSPVIQMSQSGGGGGVLLQCESEGWYPEPEVLWLDGEGDVLSAGPTETVRRPDDLYTVSSRLTVDQRHSNNFTCRVQQKSINQTRETHVHVPDNFFMVPSTPSTPSTPDAPSTSGVVIGSVIAAFIALFIAALLFVVWKWRQKKSEPKRRSPEDGPDQTEEEKTVSSKSDNTGSQVVMEGEGEREPLMADENNVDDRGEEGERKDETHHGELVTEPDVDGADGGRGIKSIEQDMAGRQVKNDGDEDGGEQTVKPVEEDSGLPLVLVEEGLEESNVHQEVQKEGETRQDPMNDVDKKEAKKENKQKEVSSGRTGQKKNWREGMQPEVGRRSVELQSKTQKRKDEMKLKQQKGGVLEDRKQEGREAEHREKIEKHQEGNQSDRTTTTGREAENQKELINVKPKETEEKRELQRQEVEARDLRTPEGALDASRQEAEHDRTTTTMTGRKAENQKELINETVKEMEDERQKEIKRDEEKMELKTQEGDGSKDQEGNQRDFTRKPKRKPENGNVQINEKSKEVERAKKPPSAGREETRKRPDLKRHQETAGREHQELQQEEESEKSPEGTKKQPERCTIGKGRREDGTDENQKKSEEMRRRGQQQQQEDVIEEVRQQPEESSQRLTDGGVKSQEVEAIERDKHLRTQEGASDASRHEAEHLDEEGKDQEGKQSDRTTTMTERKAENQKELINETVKEMEDERQEEIKRDGEKMELKTQEGDGSKDQEGNQRDFTRKVQINEKSEETEREKKPPSAGREETRKRPDLRRHQETAGREHQELQQEEESEKDPEGTKKQPERCSVGKGRREDRMDEGPDVDENQQKSEEMRRRGQQQEDVIEEVRQQPEESSQRLTDGGVKSQEVEQEEPMEVNTLRPRLTAKRGVRRQKQEQKVPVVERKKKRKDREEGADTEDFQEAKKWRSVGVPRRKKRTSRSRTEFTRRCYKKDQQEEMEV